MSRQKTLVVTLCVLVAVLTGPSGAAFARGKRHPEPQLTKHGQELKVQYEKIFSSLRAEIVAALPDIDEKKKAAFLKARAMLNAIQKPETGATGAQMAEYNRAKSAAESNKLHSARVLLADLDEFLGSDALDGKLVRVAILVHGTPGQLAAFAEQGREEGRLLDELFGDKALMKQILVAGGASGGRYGEAMKAYTAILKVCERARERGSIFQRLALGTSLEMAPRNRGREVERYRHYEEAYLAGELDPAFKDMTTWECRRITNGSRSNEELAWMRDMLRTFRPDHIRNPNYKWRYTRIVKSDMPYRSTRTDPSLGTRAQQALALGGSCGPRAWFGRLAARAFGIPSRKHPQTGHGAMSHWTPTGWTVNFGAWWSYSPGGLDFYVESRAREFPEAYMEVLRSQWIADALGEEDVDRISYGRGGGFWNQLAFCKKEVIVEDARIAKSEEEKALAALSAEEAKTLLGESDAILLDTQEEQALDIPEEHRAIVFAPDGTITIPAAGCVKPDNNTSKIAFMESWDDGWQIHYQRLGGRPQLMKYQFELPRAGAYELSARVATVSREQPAMCRINRRTMVDIILPYTKGYWHETEPVAVNLLEGPNTIDFTCKSGNRGVSIKQFTLRPLPGH